MTGMTTAASSHHLSALHACINTLSACLDEHALLERLPQLLRSHFAIERSRLLLLDAVGQPNGLMHVTGNALSPATNPNSPHRSTDTRRNHLSLPLLRQGHLLGLLQVVAPAGGSLREEDAMSLAIIAHYLAQRLPTVNLTTAQRSVVRHYAADNTIFIDENYLIKGVAGAILWKLVCEHRDHQRSDFCNRELRRDPALGLPQVLENLESRLILLQRRLNERCPFLAIEKTGRGRFRLRVDRLLQLSEA